MVERRQVLRVVQQAIAEINETLSSDQWIGTSPETVLFGEQSSLDSIALVNLIVAVEEGISEEFGVSVVLADDRAMSRRTSPFRSVQTLCDHVVGLLEEKVHG